MKNLLCRITGLYDLWIESVNRVVLFSLQHDFHRTVATDSLSSYCPELSAGLWDSMMKLLVLSVYDAVSACLFS